MLKASGRFKTNSCLLRLFIIRHLLGRLTLIKLEWFQISVPVPATCGSCTSFTCTFESIFNDVSQPLVLLVHSKSRSIMANSSASIIILLPNILNIRMFPVTSLAVRFDAHLTPRGFKKVCSVRKKWELLGSPLFAANPSPES